MRFKSACWTLAQLRCRVATRPGCQRAAGCTPAAMAAIGNMRAGAQLRVAVRCCWMQLDESSSVAMFSAASSLMSTISPQTGLPARMSASRRHQSHISASHSCEAGTAPDPADAASAGCQDVFDTTCRSRCKLIVQYETQAWCVMRHGSNDQEARYTVAHSESTGAPGCSGRLCTLH
jgi:hypothetical protein